LANASDKLASDFGSWKTPWGDINRFQRLNDDTVAEHLASGAATAAGDAPATEPTSETGAADEAGA